MNLRHLWLAAAIVLLGSASARAQGAAAGWSGIYIGAHAGGAWNDLFYVEPDDPDAALSPKVKGLAGGVVAGYSRPLDRLIVGMEFDTGAARGTFAAEAEGGNQYSAFEVGWNSHLRGRVAYPTGRFAPFFAAGLAALRITVDDTDTGFGEGAATHLGWTAGGGIDAALSSQLAVRAEYLRDNYSRATHAIASPPGPFFPGYDVEIDSTADIFRVAVLYRF
ncbi:MAG: outer membrane protein [Vicinamibacterales bacterium]